MQSPLNSFRSVLAFIFLSQALSACSLGTPPNHVLRLALPSNKAIEADTRKLASEDPILKVLDTSSAYAETAHSSTEAFLPTSLGDFSCFAINVTGQGIRTDSRLHCPSPSESLGKFVGFIPARTGSSGAQELEIEVPSGSSRTIQIVGIHTHEECPSIDALLNNTYSGKGNIDPYLVAMTTFDVFEDREVRLQAVPGSFKKVFEGCELTNKSSSSSDTSGSANDSGNSGPTVNLAGGFKGYFSESGASSTNVRRLFKSNDFVISGLAGGSFLTNSDLTIADLATLNDASYSDNALSSSGIVSQPAAGQGDTGKRAAIQLQWDLTNADLTRYPYIKIELQLQGGRVNANGGTCSYLGESEYDRRPVVRAAVLHGTATLANSSAAWIPFGVHSESDGRLWNYAGVHPGILTSKLLKTSTDSNSGVTKKYIVVNLESSWGSNSSSCLSTLNVRMARLNLMPQAPTSGSNGCTTCSLSLESLAETGHVPQGGAYDAPAGTQVYALPVSTASAASSTMFFAKYGKPPYSYALTQNLVNGSTLDSVTGYYKAPQSVGLSYDEVQVTDSSVPAQTAKARIYVLSASAILRFKAYDESGLNGVLASGSCSTFSVAPVTFGDESVILGAGNNVTATAATNVLDPMNIKSFFYGQSALQYCQGGVQAGASSITVTGSAQFTSQQFYYRPQSNTLTEGSIPYFILKNSVYPFEFSFNFGF